MDRDLVGMGPVPHLLCCNMGLWAWSHGVGQILYKLWHCGLVEALQEGKVKLVNSECRSVPVRTSFLSLGTITDILGWIIPGHVLLWTECFVLPQIHMLKSLLLM